MIDTRMLETTLPSWFKLLDYGPWRLTLPFMVGALRESDAIPSHGEDFDHVYGLLQDMASYRIPPNTTSHTRRRVVYAQICARLKVPVFSIRAEAVADNCRARYPSHEAGNTRLCFSTEVEGEKSIELRAVAQRLFERYDHRTALSSKHYSRDLSVPVWRAFDDNDRSAILAALGRTQLD